MVGRAVTRRMDCSSAFLFGPILAKSLTILLIFCVAAVKSTCSRIKSARSVPRVSNVLGVLRLADIVRYDSDGKRNYYRLKHPGEIRQVLTALSRFVKFASTVAARHP